MTGISIYFWKSKIVIPTTYFLGNMYGIEDPPITILEINEYDKLVQTLKSRIEDDDIILPVPPLKEMEKRIRSSSGWHHEKPFKNFYKEITNHWSFVVGMDNIEVEFWKPSFDRPGYDKDSKRSLFLEKDPKMVADFVLDEIGKLEKD